MTKMRSSRPRPLMFRFLTAPVHALSLNAAINCFFWLDRMSVSPMRMALKPAAASFSTSSCVLMPLSATTGMLSGTMALNFKLLLKSTRKSLRFRLLMPIIFAPDCSARVTSAAV
ncbi:hypothetical protein FAM18119_00033 [Lacticaseibacillus paracasei]|nr:hypothetical protein FAM18119_00033 [Lacticaseibacillus paracasei]